MSAYPRTRRLLTLPFLALITLLVALALVVSSWAVAPDADAATKRKIHKATQIMKNQIGDPYAYGAEGPHRFDCSGLPYFAYRKVGIGLPRSSDAQYRHMRGIRKKNMKRGDFMFLHNGSGVYHMGVFMGWKDGRRVILHSPNSGSRVHRQKMWTSSWWAATLRPKH